MKGKGRRGRTKGKDYNSQNKLLSLTGNSMVVSPEHLFRILAPEWPTLSPLCSVLVM